MITFNIPCELDKTYSLTIADDGRVAYAYLMFYEDIVGDVWLYNRTEAPTTTFWNNDDLPALNPAEYIKKDSFVKPVTTLNEIRCEWTESGDGIIEVDILLHGKFIAQLAAGSKPGWSVLVVKDGPLALVY